MTVQEQTLPQKNLFRPDTYNLVYLFFGFETDFAWAIHREESTIFFLLPLAR